MTTHSKLCAGLSAMPAALRPLVFAHDVEMLSTFGRRLYSSATRASRSSNKPSKRPSRSSSSQTTTTRPSRPPPPPAAAAASSPSSPAVPPARSALAFLPPPSNAPQDDLAVSSPSSSLLSRAPAPSPASLTRAEAVFLSPQHGGEFLYSAPRFLHVRVNTRVPEVCLLGRSNVGKSTLINALAGLETGGLAGKSHGSRRTRPGLAVTSAKAGSTRMMNAYGFGPPASTTTAAAVAGGNRHPLGQRAAGDHEGADDDGSRCDTGTSPRKTARGRKDDRARVLREPPPRHSLVLMDMPGYGLHSREEWGAEIAKYLSRRAMLRGAVLLVDAVAGIKDGDRLALRLLRDAGVRTAVVLTKADKVLRGPGGRRDRAAVAANGGAGTADGVAPPVVVDESDPGWAEIRQQCLRVWGELREAEGRGLEWAEGHGWGPEIWVTGAGDPMSGGLGVAGVRLAICRLAGLADRAGKPAGGGAAPKIVPFDQIQWPSF